MGFLSRNLGSDQPVPAHLAPTPVRILPRTSPPLPEVADRPVVEPPPPVVKQPEGIRIVDDNPDEGNFNPYENREKEQAKAPTADYSQLMRNGVLRPQEQETEPAQQRPRKLCHFFQAGACRFGFYCNDVHGLTCPTCRRPALFPNDQAQQEAHRATCAEELERREKIEASKSFECGICLENVVDKKEKFGLLTDCAHCFCLPCIRGWRGTDLTKDLSKDATRRCPLCRTLSYQVIPSFFMATEPEIKQKLLEEYKLRNSQKRCTNFNYLQPDASCKFGSSCHFAHVDPDGVPVQVMPRMYMTDEQEVRYHKGVTISDFLFRPPE